MTSSPTAKLISTLPESLWAEANRRLRLAPELWALAQQSDMREAFAALATDVDRWQPAALALAAYAVRHPECDGAAELWLLGTGHKRLASAYTTLLNPGAPFDALDDALPAALALRLRGTATLDWRAIAADALAQPARWRLVFQYLWGLLASPDEFLSALLEMTPQTASLAAHCLAANLPSEAARDMVKRVDSEIPASHWLALTQTLKQLGEVRLARWIAAHAAACQPHLADHHPSAKLAVEVDTAALLTATDDFKAAHGALVQAWGRVKAMRVEVASQIGQLALMADEPGLSLAAYQDALVDEPDNWALHLGQARALLQMNESARALEILNKIPGGAGNIPAALLTARAHLALNQPEQSQAILEPLQLESLTNVGLLAEAAQLLRDLGRAARAARLMDSAAELARTDPALYLNAARWHAEANEWESAEAHIIEAVALAPHNAEGRELLGHALIHLGQPAEAIRHFQSAVAFEPARHSASLGLARAALAASNALLARDAAKALLAAVSEGPIEGEAHVTLGEALSALNQDDDAFQHFSRASQLLPHAPGPWRAMARHHLARGEQGQAIAALEAGRQALAIAKSLTTSPLLADLAEVYEGAGRSTDAIAVLREACAADPQAFDQHRQLGMWLRRSGEFEDAIATLRHALQLRPGDWRTLHELGLALEAVNQTSEAWAAYQQATLARPAEAAPYYDLGRATLAQIEQENRNAAPAQAVAALRDAVQRDADNADAHALLAQAYHRAGDPASALASYQNALQRAPMRTEWSLGFGQVCLELNRNELAITALEDALQHAPHHLAIHRALTEAFMRSALWEDASRTAEAALRLDPENAQLFAALAESVAHLGQPDRAAGAWQKAVNLDPRNTQMQIRYARSLLDLGRSEEARHVFAHALSLAPDSSEVHVAAGQALLELGESEQAYTTLAHAVTLAPRNPHAHATFGEAALRAQRYEAAHAAYLRAAELEPARAEHWREAGEALWKMGRLSAAIELWQRAIKLNPQDNATLTRLGAALLHIGQASEALAALETAVEQNPGDANAAREAARAAIMLGDLDKAARYLERAVDLAPGDAEVRYLLGQVYDRQSHLDIALTLYRQASRLNAGEGRYLAAAAEVMARLGDANEAVAQMTRAAALCPDSAEVQQRAGEIFLSAHQPEAAAEAFQHWITAQPREASAHLALARALISLSEKHELELRAGASPKASAKSDLHQPRVLSALQQAAAFGADPQLVRYWLGRAKAAGPSAKDAQEAQQHLESVAASAQFKGPDYFRALGVALRKNGQPERAREALQAALAQDNNAALTYLQLGLTHAALNDKRGTVVAFKRAVAADPHSAIAHYHLAEALQALGDQTDSMSALQRAVSLKPEVAGWHHHLAKWHSANGDAGALAHYQHAAQLEPDSAEYNADLARVLAKDGDMPTALDFFKKATQHRTDDGQLWTERGQTHLTLGDPDGAGECFDKAIALTPASMAALLGSARVSLKHGDLHDAANKAESALRAAPENAEALICLADVKAAQGEVASAEEYYATAAAKSADPAPALLALGRLHLAEGQAAKAVETLALAAAANPASDDIIATLGEAQEAAHDYASAVGAYREAVRIAPRNARHLLRLGRACRAQGQLDQAISHLMQARENSPHSDEVMREIGLVFEQRKQYDRALEMYQLAIKSAPRAAANYARAGVALRQLKDYAGSVNALERAVALDPKNLEATRQLAAVTALNIIHGTTPVGAVRVA